MAEGGGFEFESILALNVRTEIAYGMVTDGCTALSWKSSTNGLSFLAQNWDVSLLVASTKRSMAKPEKWQHEQKANLIRMEISQRDKPKIHMITEAGIIGKIGLNSAGVGVTLNAIKARGVDYNRLPCHLALRTVLESQSREVAVKQLENAGVASACHILVADKTGGIGLECGASDIIRLPMADGIVSHTNHYLEPHQILETKLAFPDSPVRLARIRELIQNAGPEPSASKIEQMLQDEKNYPASICRAETEKSTVATLFSIVMDLPAREARVKVGRPIKPESIIIMGRVRESSA